MTRHVVTLFLLGVGVASLGCGSSSKGTPSDGGGSGGNGGNLGSAGTGGGSQDGGGTGPDSGSATGGAGGGGVVPMGTGGAAGATATGNTQCSDGIDNDNDGRIDLVDFECVSPLDNDESSFATGISGDNKDACKQDCFFDGNSGGGDDGCEWQLKCDPANAGIGATASCPYDPSFNNCPAAQSTKCVNSCRAVTPNGCDCFGCCVVAGVDHPIRLDATCSSAGFNDTTKCPACTQQASCMNTCGPCQLCLGKTTVDPSCNGTTTDGGVPTSDGGVPTSDGGVPSPVCPGTQTVCGTNAALCLGGTVCVTGCCVPWIF